MLTLFRWMLRLTIAALVLAVAAATLIWYFATRSLPEYGDTLRVTGISAPVEIIRSSDAVPHIFAARDEDAFFALGVAHAQDRLFQMVMLRRAAQGRLSEVYGEGAFAQDDLVRRLALAQAAQTSFDAQDQATKDALNAYAAGVNQWIEQVNLGARGRGAPEFFLFPEAIPYWRPADSIAILKLLAAASTRQITDEVTRARLSLALPSRGVEVMAGATDDPALPAYASLFRGNTFPTRPSGPAQPDQWHMLAGFAGVGTGFGGHAWAAGPQRTASAGALLANDPQIGLTAPGLFYLARLQLRSGDAIGATVPGIPVVLSGRNPHLAWGVAPAGIDDLDVLIEEVQPGAADNYRGPNGWTSFQTRRETIRIKGADPRTITLRNTTNGPVIPGGHFALDSVMPSGHVAALRWTGLSAQDASISALMGLMRAQSQTEAQAALQGLVAPALSVSLADDSGVQQVLAGAVPLRPADHPTQGLMPAPAFAANSVWQGVETGARLLQTLAPDQPGLVASTGNQPGTHLGDDRLASLLAGREVHSRDSFIDAQLDTVSPAARRLLPLVGANLWFTGDPAAPGTPERQRQDALQLLAEWDGNMSEHLPEPMIYAAWMRHLQLRLIRDELGPLAEDITTLRPDFIERVFRNRNGAAVWCDVVQSEQAEDCTTIARQALDAAILDLTARFGADVKSWRWGDLHQARQIHPALGQIRAVGWIVNLTQSLSGGDFTLNAAPLAGDGSGLGRWQTGFGPGYRAVYDLADPDNSVFITSTGQSGHPLSRHYDDQSERWRRGEYITMSLDPALAQAANAGITRLEPAGGQE
ncbi:MAG: penicillin acylase family protein [Paracoccus sp. (in: a-proteobacteria)]|uniref:penicillin acylase family protein n=1 Tax=Paracoccus sp. TaxID=267 RepID=UPI0026E0CEF7|nr:penicillin acylase family protein [Paracoccus sp. (in: a-proteobacteria)]MDO5620570.1 penicillin acylase family protein [Paracoccus sp. (in: a-proteobacteria)]